ncbi:TlpA family protein disulfide reductase [Selenihalanaerobacter shriftii]|uniref:Peroxiredoxin n=1 Tax=Selenihalanaerobacter shriftii TaxID=142842 RepID=A0A1T4JUR0_9FIRM|nr:TlpA disulfide reductase family protein [Selenihalanaerobacter shriftii]SJZ33873.1 Peroxiredoxin [Selenihalanaerobacter shriftii]
MKRIILILFVIAFCSGISISLIFAPKSATQPENLKIPDLTLKTNTGKKINLSKNINTKTILLFWLPKSLSCQKQLQTLQKIQNEYSDSVLIYGVSIGTIEKEAVEEIKIENSITYPLLIDKDAKLSEELLISAIPTLIFINNQGIMVEKHVGLMDIPELKKNLNSIAQQPNK